MSPTQSLEDSSLTLDTLAVELRMAILREVPDFDTLKSLILSCSAYHQAYLKAQREVLLSLLQQAYNNDGLDLQLPLLAYKARDVDVFASNHFQTFTDLLADDPENKALSKQATIDISSEQCKQLLNFHWFASRICDDVSTQTVSHCPTTGEIKPNARVLSRAERRRISVAIYRWELWSRLFVTREISWSGRRQSPEAKIDATDQVSYFLARYPLWEQEQLGCVCDYATRRYVQLFDEAATWFDQNKRSRPINMPEDDMNPWWMLSEEEDAGTRDFRRDAIVSRGPRLLAQLLRMNDLEERCDTIMDYISTWDPSFKRIFSEEYKTQRLLGADIQQHTGEVPYGWKWAQSDMTGKRQFLDYANEHLWHWGYVFWDEDRLRQWGIQALVYADEFLGSDNPSGIYARDSHAEVPRRASVAEIWGLES